MDQEKQQDSNPGREATKPPYTKPILEEQQGMIFPEEIWQEFNDRHWCFGCTNCNCN